MQRLVLLAGSLACAVLLAGGPQRPADVPAAGLAPNAGAPPVPDPMAAVAARYAPFVYHATHPRLGRQDVPTNIDFDGDLVGRNNWEHFDRFRLRPTVYYAVVATETHVFLAYHLFHPRDWSRFPLGLNDTHENDGENLQVVVRRRDGRVVLLWTQAHYRSRVYAHPGDGFGDGATRLRGPFTCVDDDGRPGPAGRHVAVFVERGGHGIYGASGRTVRLGTDGRPAFAGGSGLLFRPARPGEAVDEPARYDRGEVPYRLDSVTGKLWPLLRDGRLSGDGRLLDGAWRYRDSTLAVRVPRFYDADRFSGPLGPDRGISPFALDVGFRRGTLGALFFDPARRYAERLRVPAGWSRTYTHHPFRAP